MFWSVVSLHCLEGRCCKLLLFFHQMCIPFKNLIKEIYLPPGEGNVLRGRLSSCPPPHTPHPNPGPEQMCMVWVLCRVWLTNTCMAFPFCSHWESHQHAPPMPVYVWRKLLFWWERPPQMQVSLNLEVRAVGLVCPGGILDQVARKTSTGTLPLH